MQGKTVFITGATNGIGQAAALALAKMGATVIVGGRSVEKTERVVEQIRAESGNPNVRKAIADLALPAQVRELAAEIRQRYDRLDILINNAGAFFSRRQFTSDGLEMTFALNHLGGFLLTNLLLDLLKGSAPARIINVSSEAQQAGSVNWEDVEMRNGPNGFAAYASSKLYNLLFTLELARRLEGTGVTANAMHPGFVATGFSRNNGRLFNIGMTLVSPFIRTPEQGADTIVYLASSPDVANVTGRYYFSRRQIKAKDVVTYENARRLWEATEAVLERVENAAPQTP
jgi:NAD(P)-dependent dehydrogenase (short-subunit alcohol dehydrogenase family)